MIIHGFASKNGLILGPQPTHTGSRRWGCPLGNGLSSRYSCLGALGLPRMSAIKACLVCDRSIQVLAPQPTPAAAVLCGL